MKLPKMFSYWLDTGLSLKSARLRRSLCGPGLREVLVQQGY